MLRYRRFLLGVGALVVAMLAADVATAHPWRRGYYGPNAYYRAPAPVRVARPVYPGYYYGPRAYRSYYYGPSYRQYGGYGYYDGYGGYYYPSRPGFSVSIGW